MTTTHRTRVIKTRARSGALRQGKCSCGWLGPLRSRDDSPADADAAEHRAETASRA